MKKITVKNLQKPKEKNTTKDILWICNSLGLSSGRDTDSISNRIVGSVIKKAAMNKKPSSITIAHDLDISLGMANHHLRNIIDMGFLYREKKAIYLRGGSLNAAVEEMRKDANRIFDEISHIAKEVDRTLGLSNR